MEELDAIKNEDLISVVIPVYNVDKYLQRCVSSVLQQKSVNYEIVLVDDGSTDNSGAICDEYSKSFSNVRVIHKDNRGLSDTRNCGVNVANGEYIYFLDSDDYITPDSLWILYDNLKKYNADISCGSFGFFDERTISSLDVGQNNIVRSYSGKEACRELLYCKGFYTSSCNILIKKHIAVENPFPVGKFHEDELTTFRFFLSSSEVVITSAKTYHYYQREGSITHGQDQAIIDEVFAANNYVEYFAERNNSLLKAAKCKKYQLYCDVVEKYPNLRYSNPDVYGKVIAYLKTNGFNVLCSSNTTLSLKKEALKHMLKLLGVLTQ